MEILEAAKSATDALSEAIDIPDGYYNLAVERFTSLGDWLNRAQSSVAKYGPLVYPQGSFRLGTVNRPAMAADEFDLDLVCELQSLSVDNMSQEQLKELLGDELKRYAEAHGIKEPVRESKKCWRIDYADH